MHACVLIFYRASIESIVRYGITSWFGNLTVKLKSEILRLAKMAGKIMGMSGPPKTPQAIFEQATLEQAKKTVSDPSHVLYPEYRLMPSGRRYEVPKWRYNRFKFSFIPMSTTLLNDTLAVDGRGGRRRR